MKMKLILITVIATAFVLGGAVSAEAATKPPPSKGFNISVGLPFCPPLHH